MNPKQMNDEQQQQALMDACERACIIAVLSIFKTTHPFMTENQARNIVGTVGVRIAQGPQVLSQLLNKEKPDANQS